MSLISRDQMPPRSPYEAELRERVQRAEERAAMYERLACWLDIVAEAAQAVLAETPARLAALDALAATLKGLEEERGRIMLDSMPPELRAALTGPSAFVEALKKAQPEPLFSPQLDGGTNLSVAHAAILADARRILLGPRSARIAIHAIVAHPAGTERWAFDFADSFDEAYEKLNHWNERAVREWPDMRFTLEVQP